MIPHYPLFINGEFKDSQERLNVLNPATGEIIAQVCLADEKEVDSAVSSSRLAFDDGEWRRISLTERKDYLLKISQGILNKANELAKLETQNTGKPIKESTFMDIPSAAKTLNILLII